MLIDHGRYHCFYQLFRVQSNRQCHIYYDNTGHNNCIRSDPLAVVGLPVYAHSVFIRQRCKTATTRASYRSNSPCLFRSIWIGVSFSRKVIIVFRGLIILHMIMVILENALLFSVVFAPESESWSHSIYKYRRYVALSIYGISVVWFFGFAAWFAYAAYWIAERARTRRRIIQLVILSFVQAVMFATEFGCALYIASIPVVGAEFTEKIITFQLFGIAVLTVRCIMCLMELGVTWPRREKTTQTAAETPRTIYSSQDTYTWWPISGHSISFKRTRPQTMVE